MTCDVVLNLIISRKKLRLQMILYGIMCLRIFQLHALHSGSNIFSVKTYGGVGDGRTDRTKVHALLGESKIFSVKTYGAVGDGRTDCTKAFKSAWADACGCKGIPQIDVPGGTYLVGQQIFEGPCKGSMNFHNSGILRAHNIDDSDDFWIAFQYVNSLNIFGGGSFDGMGQYAIRKKLEDDTLNVLPMTLYLAFVNDSSVTNVNFINSKGAHMRLYKCNHVDLIGLTITAPGDSPNTDGINIGYSSNIRVSKSHISTGDDCISFLPGAVDINITDIFCGPGHGISIGSLGSQPNEPAVKGINVRNCNFTNTLNGLRIKTWATSNQGSVADILFQNIFLTNASNPVIIDQNYCPSGQCPKGDSHVEIKNTRFMDIQGVSSSRIAVNFQCSKYRQCYVETSNINLKYDGKEGPITSSCTNVKGVASGIENPPSCISK